MRLIICLIYLSGNYLLAQKDSLQKTISSVEFGMKRAYEIGFPKDIPTIIFDQNGGVSDGVTANDEAIFKIFNLYPDGATIIFGKGTYYFKKGIRLPSFYALRGEGIDSTILKFDLEKEEDLILVQGKRTRDRLNLTRKLNRGDREARFNDRANFKEGDWVLIVDDDSELVTSDWAKNKSGQLNRIKEISTFELEFESSVRRDYYLKNGPHLIRIEPKEGCFISRLTINRLDETQHMTSNIQFRYAVNCSVDKLKSDNCNYAHVLLEYAANCEVNQSIFQYGFTYGGGGKAYGVVMQFATSECLVQYNLFRNLRHSMLVQAGANGNKFYSNTSAHPYWKEHFLPKRAAGDIVLHGNYPYANYFVRNTAANLVIDDSHGKSGPLNFFDTNTIYHYGLIMNNRPATDSMIFVKNKITGSGLLKGKFRIRGEGHQLIENKVKGKIRPKIKE